MKHLQSSLYLWTNHILKKHLYSKENLNLCRYFSAYYSHYLARHFLIIMIEQSWSATVYLNHGDHYGSNSNESCTMSAFTWHFFYLYLGIVEQRKLRIAVGLNNVDAVEQLLKEDVNPRMTDDKERSPLHIAASKGYAEIARWGYFYHVYIIIYQNLAISKEYAPQSRHSMKTHDMKIHSFYIVSDVSFLLGMFHNGVIAAEEPPPLPRHTLPLYLFKPSPLLAPLSCINFLTLFLHLTSHHPLLLEHLIFTNS